MATKKTNKAPPKKPEAVEPEVMPDGHREPRIQAGNVTLPRTIR